MSRRDLFRAGGSASALLAGGALLSGLTGCSATPQAATGFKVLRQADIDLLQPLVPAVIGSAIKGPDDTLRCLALLDELLFASSENMRGMLFQLYDLLQLGLARWYFMDQWSAPAEMDLAARQQGLAYWSKKDNSFSRLALIGLTKPLLMVWYADTRNSLATGYPGPPKKVVS